MLSIRNERQERAASLLAIETMRHIENTDKRPVKVGSVEMEEVLNAEHCVLPCNEIQDCADANIAEVRRVRNALLVDRILSPALELLPYGQLI